MPTLLVRHGGCTIPWGHRIAAERIDSLARAFWNLLAAADELAEYRDRTYHPGAGVWMDYGCANGAVFLEEYEDD